MARSDPSGSFNGNIRFAVSSRGHSRVQSVEMTESRKLTLNLVPSIEHFIEELPDRPNIGIHRGVLGHREKFRDLAASRLAVVQRRGDANAPDSRGARAFRKSRRGEQHARHRPTNRLHYRTGCHAIT